VRKKLSDTIARARKENIRRWLIDPHMSSTPKNMTMEEINAEIDAIEVRVKQLRAIYPK